MKLCGSAIGQNVLQLLLIAGIIFFQIFNQFNSDLPAIPDIASGIALAATSLLALLHVGRYPIRFRGSIGNS